ncbi:MAG: hypothetical protein CMD16_05180 [Flavobacteriales bacterium]|nr:hypothetical protein [Flavobacteriales bacterium]|tara:strand:- start:9202 stop:11046 length:1845 start_codon:yes stop_codon:yes gene_type:complete
MKKIITIITCTFISLGISAQITAGKHSSKLKAKNDKITLSGDEALSHLMINPNPNTSAILNSKATMTEEVIGTSTYDLQTNGSVQNRILVHDDGTISATWTMSSAYNNVWADRGTGYNFFDGTSWGAQPTSRLESSRGGWPSIIALGNGGECAITHNTDGSFINNTYRSSIGTGSWIENPITNEYLIWNRSVAGGLDGNTIHMIGVTASSNFNGTPFNGLDGALVYYRSQDGGDSWDIQKMQLPGMDSSMYTGMNGDVYAIAAQGETVVVAYFDSWGDSYIVKSTANGDSATWTKTIFLDFPVDKYTMDDGLDLDNNDTTDHVYSTDNYGALILDPNGDAHVFYGMMQYADDDLTDAASSWYPGENGIVYWNESYGADTTSNMLQDTIGYVDAAGIVTPRGRWWSNMMNNNIITAAPDLNNDGQVAGIDSTGGYALYYASRASMPNAGLDAAGNIWLSFSAYTETVDNSVQVFRHLYITKSEDGGATWKTPVNVTPHDGSNGGADWDGMQECVFGSMDKLVDDKIRIVYQLDFEPGLAVRGDEDFVDNNDIVYLEIDTVGLFSGTIPTAIIENENNNITDGKIFDILGREWKANFADLPKGIYVIDRKKIFKAE